MIEGRRNMDRERENTNKAREIQTETERESHWKIKEEKGREGER